MQGDLAGARIELDAALELFRGVEDPKRLANALCGRGLRRAVRRLARRRRGRTSTSRWRCTRSSATTAATRGPGTTWRGRRSCPATSCRPRRCSAQARAQFGRLGDRVGVNWAEGLRAYVTYFQRRFDEAEELAIVGDRRRQALGRHVGAADDADAARQHAPVERPARRGRAVRRAGARRVPRSRRPLRHHELAGAAQPGAGRARQVRRGPPRRRGVDLARPLVRRARAGPAGSGRRGDAPRRRRRGVWCSPTRCSNAHRAMGASDAEATGDPRHRRCASSAASTRRSPRSRTLDVDDFPFGSRRGRWCARWPATRDARSPTPTRSTAPPARATSTSRWPASVASSLPVPHGRRRRQCRLARALTAIATSAGDVVFVGIARALARESATVPESLGSGRKRIVEQAVSPAVAGHPAV